MAREVGRQLRADYFERWLLDEAMRSWPMAPTAAWWNWLAPVLAVGRRQGFDVVDHFAADELRSVRTSPAGRLSRLAGAGAVAGRPHRGTGQHRSTIGWSRSSSTRGFGTLDAETLEVVAAVIADIGATGKTVGFVTHVAALAEQAPVRFEVATAQRGRPSPGRGMKS